MFVIYSWEMVTVKELYDLDPYVEWLPFLNEVFNPVIRIQRHTQVNLQLQCIGYNAEIEKYSNEFNQVAIPSEEVIKKMGALVKEMEVNFCHKISLESLGSL